MPLGFGFCAFEIHRNLLKLGNKFAYATLTIDDETILRRIIRKFLVTIRRFTTLVSQQHATLVVGQTRIMSDKYLNYDDINSKIIRWFRPQGSFTHLLNKFDDYDHDANARIQQAFAWWIAIGFCEKRANCLLWCLLIPLATVY